MRHRSRAVGRDARAQARLTYADLDLSTRAGEDALVERVADAAAPYCARHAEVVTPHARRAEPRYCLERLRVQLLWAMPPAVRVAYDRGRPRTDGRVRARP